MSPNSPLKFYEFFAGGGMARLGLGEKWACLYANDFDPVKAAAYRQNFSDAQHFHQGDVWKVQPADLPGRADLAWASSPCQDFSLAGARAGLEGGRSSAFFGFWKLVEGLAAEGRAPRAIVIENVVGLLTSHGGKDFEALCQSLADQHYRFGAVEIDAARFLPQSRRRVFIVATRSEAPDSTTQLQPTLPFHSARVQKTYEQLPRHLQAKWHWWRLPFPPPQNEDLSSVLEPDEAVSWFSPQRRDALISLLGLRHRETLSKAMKRKRREVGTIFRRMRVEQGIKVQRAELRVDGIAGCLRVPRGGSSTQFVIVVNQRDVRIRSLSPRESARLMGLSDDYLLPSRANAALSITGDGVAVPVVRWLSQNLLEPLLGARSLADDDQAEGRRTGT